MPGKPGIAFFCASSAGSALRGLAYGGDEGPRNVQARRVGVGGKARPVLGRLRFQPSRGNAIDTLRITARPIVNDVGAGFEVELHPVSRPAHAETLILDGLRPGQKEGGLGRV